MTGLLLIFLAAVWLALTTAVAYFGTKRIESAVLRSVSALLLFSVLLPLPLINEIVGKYQFEQLCKDNATIRIDRATAVGKTVYLAESTDVEIKGKWLRFVVKPWRYVDVTTGETVVSYKTLMADGGLFFRMIRISEGGVPLTFKGSCYPGELSKLQNLFQELNVTQVQRSELPLEETK